MLNTTLLCSAIDKMLTCIYIRPKKNQHDKTDKIADK